jgi:hypothetical protein
MIFTARFWIDGWLIGWIVERIWLNLFDALLGVEYGFIFMVDIHLLFIT